MRFLTFSKTVCLRNKFACVHKIMGKHCFGNILRTISGKYFLFYGKLCLINRIKDTISAWDKMFLVPFCANLPWIVNRFFPGLTQFVLCFQFALSLYQSRPIRLSSREQTSHFHATQMVFLNPAYHGGLMTKIFQPMLKPQEMEISRCTWSTTLMSLKGITLARPPAERVLLKKQRGSLWMVNSIS